MRSWPLFIQPGSLLFAILFAISANAQIDPSSALLLNSGSRSASKDSGLDSGRYTVRPRDGAKREESRSSSPRRSMSVGGSSGEGGDDSAMIRENGVNAFTPTPTPTPPAAQVTVQDGHGGPITVMIDQPEAPDFRRTNLLELSVAPSFIYVDSNSTYSYRRYSTSGPGIGAEAHVWLTSAFALHAGYLSSLSGNVSDSKDGSKSTSATQQWLNVGFRTRQFFGETRLAPLLSLGIDYLDYDFRVPADSDIRARLKSTGVALSLEGELPTGPTYAWILGVGLSPKLQHKETSNATDFASGGSVDANAVSFSLGGRFRFDHENTMFWKFSHTVEKDLFSGKATGVDPFTGKTPSGVSVTNSISIFQLGYTWGN